jgi:rfaE bifunctional protein nucleotidyltransferase chain/domain
MVDVLVHRQRHPVVDVVAAFAIAPVRAPDQMTHFAREVDQRLRQRDGVQHEGADRACVLAALESVSLVTLFDESTPLDLLQRVRPDLYVKGGDYDIEALAETALVRSWGGTARALPFIDGYSTTALVRRIRGPAPG